MTDPFYAAHVPESRTVLGLTLLPLSLGHLILLRRVESAFLTASPPDFNDLAVSVLICSQTYEGALEAFRDPDLQTFMRKWHDRITKNDRLSVRLGFRRKAVLDFVSECKAFYDYLSENTKGPNYIYDTEKVKPMECAPEQVIKVSLMRDLHLSETEVLNRSWRLCLWDRATLRALEGAIDFTKEEDLDRAKKVGENLLKLAKEGKLNGNFKTPR